MSVVHLRLLALVLPVAAAAAIAACDVRLGVITGLATDTTATVRFNNATNTAIDVVNDGTITAGNGNLGFGANSSCMTVSTTAGNSLLFQQAGTFTAIPGFAQNFAPGGNYTVIAFQTAIGATQFATLSNSFTPAGGQAGVRIFNAAPGAGSLDAYVTAPGAALGTASATAISFGTASSFFGVNSGGQELRLTNAGTQTVVLDAGTLIFTGGLNSTVIVAPATGTSALQAFSIPAC